MGVQLASARRRLPLLVTGPLDPLGVCKACFRNIRKRLVVTFGFLPERGYDLWAKTQKNGFASRRLASRANPRATVSERTKR